MQIAPYLNLLVTENIGVVLQTFITVLAVWMKEYCQAHGGQRETKALKNELIIQYERYADCTIAEGCYARIEAPDTVPSQMSWAKVDELAGLLNEAIRTLPVEEALPFLGELTGAWILSCPASLIHQENALNKNPRPLEAESDLIFIMQLWLARALMVGR